MLGATFGSDRSLSRGMGYDDAYGADDAGYDGYEARITPLSRRMSCLIAALMFTIIAAIGGGIFYAISQSYPQLSAGRSVSVASDSVYIPALERSAAWSDEYDCYYDAPTDCYFFMNQELNPPVWQYWFESVSAAYGDYGWLEWDAAEQCWYVQTAEYSWKQLPDAEYKDVMWHF